MTDTKEREAFEAVFLRDWMRVKWLEPCEDHDGKYDDEVMQGRWDGWQASRRAERTAPEVQELRERLATFGVADGHGSFVTSGRWGHERIADLYRIASDAIAALGAAQRPKATMPSFNDVLQAVARGWCSPANEHKQMDSILANGIALQVFALIERPAPEAEQYERDSEVIIEGADEELEPLCCIHGDGNEPSTAEGGAALLRCDPQLRPKLLSMFRGANDWAKEMMRLHGKGKCVPVAPSRPAAGGAEPPMTADQPGVEVDPLLARADAWLRVYEKEKCEVMPVYPEYSHTLIADLRTRIAVNDTTIKALMQQLVGLCHEVAARETLDLPKFLTEPPTPWAYSCPARCGCLWRNNGDGTMSLFGPRSQSCEVCEPLPLDKLLPLYRRHGFAALPPPAGSAPAVTPLIATINPPNVCVCTHHEDDNGSGYERDPECPLHGLPEHASSPAGSDARSADARDAARYRWLRDNVTLSSKNNYLNATGLSDKDKRRIYRLEWHSLADGDLDEIIDAALPAPPEQPT